MTLNEAFEYLTAKRGWYKLCGITNTQATSYKYHYKQGKLSGDKIREMLDRSGMFSRDPEQYRLKSTDRQ